MNRIVSLVPAATEMIAAMGLADQLVGRTHECDHPADVRSVPAVTRARIDVRAAGREIDRAVRELSAAGEPLFELDADLILDLRPTVIVTQGLCPVCAIDQQSVYQVASQLDRPPVVVEMQPMSLDDVLADFSRLGAVLGCADRADDVVRSLKRRIHACVVGATLRLESPRVLLLEWLDPMFSAGHWNPQLIELAGGQPALAKAGTLSRQISLQQAQAADPDVIVVAACGFDIDRTLAELPGLTNQRGWRELRAAKERRVYVLDGSSYFNRPGPRLVESLELLCGILHAHADADVSADLAESAPAKCAI